MDRSFTEGIDVPDGYRLDESVPSPETFVRIRAGAGMAPRSLEAAERGLPNSLYTVCAREGETGSDAAAADDTVGLARVVGDGGAVFHVSDVAVVEAHQGQGLGTALMDAVMAYVETAAPATAYVNLLADVDGFYDRWGFEYSAPASKGMVLEPSD